MSTLINTSEQRQCLLFSLNSPEPNQKSGDLDLGSALWGMESVVDIPGTEAALVMTLNN